MSGFALWMLARRGGGLDAQERLVDGAWQLREVLR